jgi:hypothetical protein
MAAKPNLGEILTTSGRITQADAARALRYQEDHGGYFGEALVSLGLLTHEELDWGLASQFDVPYVFPDVESIDPEAASLVSPDWALAHMTLPIMQTQRTLTVLVDAPNRRMGVEELSRRTDRTVEMALASASTIRELIRKVYLRLEHGSEPGEPASLDEAFALALGAAAERFGISARGHRAWFWYEDGGTRRRRRLVGLWEQELDRLVSPAPGERVGDAPSSTFSGRVNRRGIVTPVEVRHLHSPGGREYLFRAVPERSAARERFSAPPAAIVSEVRLLARSGAARIGVTTKPRGLGSRILPHFPALLIDPSWRSVHVRRGPGREDGDIFSIALTDDRASRARELEGLKAFRFDVVTVDLEGGWADGGWSDALDLAPVGFVLMEAEGRTVAWDVGLRWEIRVEEREAGNGGLAWALGSLRS